MINYMFVSVFASLLVVVQICGIKKFSTWFNPITFFCGLWALTGAISNLGLYGYYRPSVEVNLIMAAGILSAFFVCMGLDFKGGSFKQQTGLAERDGGFVRWVCVVCCLLAIGLLLLKLPQALNIIFSQGWGYLRLAYYNNPANYDGPQYMSTIDSYLQLYVLQPILGAALYLSIWLLFKGDRGARLPLVLAIVGQLLLVFVSAGRGPLLAVFKVLVIALFAFLKKGQILSFIKRVLTPGKTVVLVAGIVFMVSVTAGRNTGEDGASLGQTIYQYYFTGPVLLTQLLSKSDPIWMPNETFMLGWATFGFIVNVPLTVGAILGVAPKTSVYWIASYLTSANLQVGDNLYSNAMCTCFYDFIMDWGYAGAFIGPLLIVAFSYFLIQKVRRQPNNPFFGCLMLYWIVLLIGTTFRWEAVDITPTCTIFFLWLFTRPRKSGQTANGIVRGYEPRCFGTCGPSAVPAICLMKTRSGEFTDVVK